MADAILSAAAEARTTTNDTPTIADLATRWADLRLEVFGLRRQSNALAEAHGIDWGVVVAGHPYRGNHRPETFGSADAIYRKAALAIHVSALTATDDRKAVWTADALATAAASVRASCNRIEAWAAGKVAELEVARAAVHRRWEEVGGQALDGQAGDLEDEADTIMERLEAIEPSTPAEASTVATVATLNQLAPEDGADGANPAHLPLYRVLWRAGDALGVDLRHLPAEVLVAAEAGQAVDQAAAA